MQEDQITTIKFREDTIFAAKRAGDVFIAVKPIVQSLGLDWKAQHRRMSDDEILREGMVTTTIPSPGGAQETTCLKLELVNGWLFTIDESRVKDEETRQRVLIYKRECYAVLFRHFQPSAAPPAPEAPLPDPSWSLRDHLALIREARLLGGVAAGRRIWAFSPFPPLTLYEAARAPMDPTAGRDCLALLLDRAPAPLVPETAEDEDAQARLASVGLRVVEDGVFLGNGNEALFTGTPWAHGRWRVALMTLPGVQGGRGVNPRTLMGLRTRGIIVPWSVIQGGAEV
jgi:hypothetical protein